MERVWAWLWGRYGSRYSWAVSAVVLLEVVSIEVAQALVFVRIYGSGRYPAAVLLGLAAAVAWVLLVVRPGRRMWHPLEHWADTGQGDPADVVAWTYRYNRTLVPRAIAGSVVAGAALGAGLGWLADSTAWRTVQLAILAAMTNIAAMAIAIHSFIEVMMRPPRLALVAGTDLGDHLPRSTPTFATWTNIAVLAVAFGFTVTGAGVATAVGSVDEHPLTVVAIALTACLTFAIPMTIASAVSPALQPLRDLADGTERVAAGDYSQRIPVTQDDDLGVLAASFNRMQAGLAERERLQAAFGSYVDPALAARLLEQGDDVFTGDRREVTVLFLDIRDFTAYAEATPAEAVVERLNVLFGIVVPAVLDAGGHVNKFLGDGAMAVFGAPNELTDHADVAVATAQRIQHLVAQRFDGELRIGIGINTGAVVAGTIGGGGKLEFTLIGDAVNVAARVEQLTKDTGDGILLTQGTLDALGAPPPGLVDRGAHPLKGKSAAVRVFAVSPGA